MRSIFSKFTQIILSVPVRVKIVGIVLIPILILGLALNYWVTTGLSDWLAYLLPDESVRIAMEAGSRSVIMVSILAALAAILLTLMLMFLLTQPLLELKNTAQDVARGDLNSRAEVWSNDEIGEVARSFNEMLDHLVQSQENLASTNYQLQLMNEIAMATTRPKEIHDQLHLILKSILSATDIPYGWIYLYHRENDKYHLATWHGVPDDLKEHLLGCSPEQLCICQQDLPDPLDKPAPRVYTCDRILGTGNGHPLQHISLPIQERNHLLGVMNLPLPEDEIDKQNMLDLLQVIQPQINEFTSKAWLEMKLSQEEQARKKLMNALIQAQEDERGRLAKELHDGAGQMLTSLLIQMKALERDLDHAETKSRIQALCQNVSNVIEYIRRLSYQNRPIVLYELGLEKAIENLVEDSIHAAGINSEVTLDLNGIKLPKEIEFTIYRIVQECLTNIIRHARAQNISLRFWNDTKYLNLEILDDGMGFDTEKVLKSKSRTNVGLNSIQERLSVLGGDLTITSELGEGTHVFVKLPLLDEIQDD
jgi:signal transduction histidine kinase